MKYFKHIYNEKIFLLAFFAVTVLSGFYKAQIGNVVCNALNGTPWTNARFSDVVVTGSTGFLNSAQWSNLDRVINATPSADGATAYIVGGGSRWLRVTDKGGNIYIRAGLMQVSNMMLGMFLQD